MDSNYRIKSEKLKPNKFSYALDYASENPPLMSDPRLEHWLLRYPQNRGSGILHRASVVAPRQNTRILPHAATF